MHCNEVLLACRVDPMDCDIFGPAERVPIYGLLINLRYIHKRVSALVAALLLVVFLFAAFVCLFVGHLNLGQSADVEWPMPRWMEFSLYPPSVV